MSEEEPPVPDEADDTTGPEDPEAAPGGRRRGGEPFGLGLVLFVLGLCVGFPLAVIGSEFLSENAGLIITFILIFVAFLGVLGIVLLMMRRRILGFLFNISHATLQDFARPLSEATRHLAARRSLDAVDSAEELAKLVLARWAWVSTRRWLIASLTGLLAALAALAGTALLFRQNELLAVQLERLDQQNDMLKTQIGLSEAERSGSILPELLTINADLAGEVAALSENGRVAAPLGLANLSEGLRARIVAATLGARPYRYLHGGTVDERDLAGMTQLALSRRPEILSEEARKTLIPQVYETRLIDRPVSPERGMIVAFLDSVGIRETERLSFVGADFSFAEVRVPVLNLMSFTFARLRFADFSWNTLNSVTFGAADLSHARLRHTDLIGCDFSAVLPEDAKPPYKDDKVQETIATNLTGTDFSRAFVEKGRFGGAKALAANFDETVLIETDFSGASIAGSTFRQAIFVRPDFAGANLKAIDLDGALVFDKDFLTKLEAEATREGGASTFRPDRFRLEPADLSAIESHPRAARFGTALETVAVGDALFRIRRVGAFR